MNHIPPTLPKQITILGKKIKVVIIEDVNQENSGEYLGDTITINLAHQENNYDLWHSYLHEVLHATVRRIGVNNAISIELEEVIVDTIATMLLECFKILPR
jgi:hypothetical protein